MKTIILIKRHRKICLVLLMKESHEVDVFVTSEM